MTAARPKLHDSEASVYEQCYRLLRLYDFAVYRLSQTRASQQSLGLPDLYAMHPERGVLWLECKTDIGKQSKAQKQFQQQCIEAKVPYLCGGVKELAHWIQTWGEILPWPRPKVQEDCVFTDLADYGERET